MGGWIGVKLLAMGRSIGGGGGVNRRLIDTRQRRELLYASTHTHTFTYTYKHFPHRTFDPPAAAAPPLAPPTPPRLRGDGDARSSLPLIMAHRLAS